MKHFYLNTKRSLTIAIAAIVLFNTCLNAQTIPELVFKNSAHVSGTPADGTDGCVYKFANVSTGIDALVKIVGRSSSSGSSSNVVLKDIDITSTGYDNSFQPLIGYNNGGSISSNTVTDWYMEFKISFVESANNSNPVTVTGFNATALDIDGTGNNGAYLHEAYSFLGLDSYTTETGTTLSIFNVMSGSTVVGKRFEAGNTEYDGIDVNASKPRVTTKYVNSSNFTVRIGGKAKGPVNISNGRQYSVWFRGFTYTVPVVNAPLPVKLLSFNARKDTKGVLLDWATSMEKDFSHFVIERSTDGKSFDEAAVIFTDDASSNSTKSYSYTDKASGQGDVVYYRLKMVDIDAKYEYSETRIIRKAVAQDQASIVVYPNPAINEVRVTIPDSWQNKSVTYSIISSNGFVAKQKVNNNASQTEILNVAGMTPGLYMVKVVKGDEILIKQFIKQN